jgi:putative transposase
LDSIAAQCDWQEIAPAWNPEPHWQEGFSDHLLRSHESYAQKWDYVRINPVRAKLCDTPEAWPYQGEIVRISFD